MSMDDFIKTLSEEQKASLLKALSGGDFKKEDLPKQNEAVEKDPEDFTMNKNASTKGNTKRVPVRGGENSWSDDGIECADIKTPESPRTPRNRRPPDMKQVTCHICGKKEKVNSNLVYGEFYRCNRCTG